MMRYGYNPSYAGEQLLKAGEAARRTLLAKVPKPSTNTEEAWEAYTLAKIQIMSMSHDEVYKALRES